MATRVTWTNTDYAEEVTVSEVDSLGASAIKDITGATIDAAIVVGSATSTGTSSITDAANGVFTISFSDADVITAGYGRIQVSLTIGTETQMVLDEPITVKSNVIP